MILVKSLILPAASELGAHDVLDLDEVLGEVADAFRELLGRHCVLVHLPPEGVLVAGDLRDVHLHGLLRVKTQRDIGGHAVHLEEQLRRDREAVAPREREDLPRGAERRPHDNGRVAVLLVVVVDLLDGEHAGVLLVGVLLLVRSLVPVEDTADEGRDEGRLRLGTCHRLVEVEEEGHVAGDPLLLQNACRLDALPGRRDLDQDPRLVDALLLVEPDDLPRLVQSRLNVEREARVHLRGDVSGHQLRDLRPEGDGEAVDGIHHLLLRRVALGALDGRIDQLCELRVRHRREDERGVGRSVHGRQGLDAVEVAGVGNDLGHRRELCACVRHSVRIRA
mmetsp:Transcript_55277/g.131288  ORF Transcript_55277/g.131288 Transcript_55277/m.131288 type:complete len:336 (-) Transcript_55277:8-1015(-)